ncbi:DedA family protein [Metaclostridioides mangenotii]|uniref:DedA family protein n=1 Tax=Metaclostridioides mangenotii TaxID=1540 RepID=UPI00046348BB|nr:DedA family protein [Clostridioides mangenotii]
MDLNIIIENFVNSYGVVSIFILVFLEYANFPIPSEVILPMVGLIGKEYNIDIFSLILLSTLAGLIGSLLNYWIGYYFGEKVVKYVVNKFPKTKKSISASNNFMKRYSKISVLLTRFVPLARTAISLIAGVARMNLAKFVIFSTIGIFIWNCLLITGGTFISELFRLEYITIEVLLALILAIVIIYLIKKLYDIYRDK